MKISCIIAEFNPLHNGHYNLIRVAKQHGDLVAVIMAGDFCQRGGSTVLDQYARARHAIFSGADLVIQLPTAYAVDCASQFALGGVRLAGALSDDVTLFFGSESGNIRALSAYAQVLADNPHDFEQDLQNALTAGDSYPRALQQALDNYATRHKLSYVDVKRPNNILALEYLRAIRLHCPRLSACTMRRTGDYHATALNDAPSSTAIRSAVESGTIDALRAMVPPPVFDDLPAINPEQTVLYLAALRHMDKQQAAQLHNAADGLGARLWQSAQDSTDWNSTLAACATKQYTNARIMRLATYALLSLTQTKWQDCMQSPLYFHVLAAKRTALSLLSTLSARGQVYTSQAELQASDNACAHLDAEAHNIYRLLRLCPTDRRMVLL